MMRFSLFVTAFLFITLSSCKSSKAVDFKESLAKSERRAFDIILGKNGSGEKKLNYLVNDDYKGALAAVDQQAIEFDKLIDDINKLSTNDVTEGEPLKIATLEYYKALKALHVFDRKEIEQQALLSELKNNELNIAQNNLIALAHQKKLLYTAVYKKEALLHTAAENFNAANGI
ncbi:hypothetical protein [Flavobacterium ginsengiterrae]|uniref:Uncharacterized protein n=1 Tax=Flavobacterium ginsengiterrae TaxID=871695 RepID=A0ABP7GAH9_9FLAO